MYSLNLMDEGGRDDVDVCAAMNTQGIRSGVRPTIVAYAGVDDVENRIVHNFPMVESPVTLE